MTLLAEMKFDLLATESSYDLEAWKREILLAGRGTLEPGWPIFQTGQLVSTHSYDAQAGIIHGLLVEEADYRDVTRSLGRLPRTK